MKSDLLHANCLFSQVNSCASLIHYTLSDDYETRARADNSSSMLPVKVENKV